MINYLIRPIVMKTLFLIVILTVYGLDLLAQNTATYRIINVSLDVSEPSGLQLNHGRLAWKETDREAQTYQLRYYSGAEIFTLDSNLAGLTYSLDGYYLGWNTDQEEIRVFNITNWSTTIIGPSYNPDYAQPVSIAGGKIAYARRAGNGSEIVVRELDSGQEAVFSEGAWNLQPSLHQGQLAWTQKYLADTSISNIYFFDGQSTRLLNRSSSSRNSYPVARDGQVAWKQSANEVTRIMLFDGDSVLTLAEAEPGSMITGYDLSDGIAVASVTRIETHATEISIYNSGTGLFSYQSDTSRISGLHIDNGLICWSRGTDANKQLILFHAETGETEEWGAAQNPVTDDGMVAWTLGDAVDMMIPTAFSQVSGGLENGWPQSRFKDHDGQRLIWGNLDNSTNARLLYSDGDTSVQLTDSLVYKDFITVNDGYALWRHDFTSMYLFDGLNPPELIIDSLQCENMYLAGDAIGFHGFRSNAGNNINQAWLFKIPSKELIQLSFDDSANVANTFTLVDGGYACWYRDSASHTMLMLYDGTKTSRLTDSSVFNEFSFRSGNIVWSEARNGIQQIMLYDVNTRVKKQMTTGSHDAYRPITDGTVALWYEDDPEGTVLVYHDLISGISKKVARHSPPVARWLWLSKGKFAWSSHGEICVFDGNVISRLTSSAPFNPNTEPYVDNDVVVWNKNNPDPNTNHYGQIFRGTLLAHVAFDAENICGTVPLAVRFHNRSFQGAGSFRWDFGDGQTSTDKDPVHTYEIPGVYSIALTVDDPTGSKTETKINLIRASQVTSTKEIRPETPMTFRLHQNYPNPFNQFTTIPFELPESSHVTLKVYDLMGNELETLVNDSFTKGHYEVTFTGAELAGGAYILRMTAGMYTHSILLNLIK